MLNILVSCWKHLIKVFLILCIFILRFNNYFILWVWMLSLPAHMPVYHLCAAPMEASRGYKVL